MKISIAMCTYNGSRFLLDQLTSFVDQRHRPHELVICDDRSDDATVRIIEQWAEDAPFPVRLRVNDRRLGTAKNFESAISSCNGDLIALSDQDDVWLPERLASADRALLADPAVGATFSDVSLVDENLKLLKDSFWQSLRFTADRRRQFEEAPHRLLLQDNVVTGMTLTFRSCFRELILPIPDCFPGFVHDRWIALLIGSVARIAPLEECLVLYRQHGGQQIGGDKTVVPPLLERARSKESVRTDLDAVETILGRLTDNPQFSPRAGVIETLSDKADHLAVRRQLPQSRLARVPAVAGELWSGRYASYSNGIRSALKDILV